MVEYRNKICTAGIAIYNSCFPKDYPFQTDIANAKNISKALDIIIDKYSSDIYREILNKLSAVGFKWATLAGSSFTMKNLIIPKEIYKIRSYCYFSKIST